MPLSMARFAMVSPTACAPFKLPPRTSLANAPLMPGSTLELLRGVGHVPHMTHSDEWVRRVTAFATTEASHG